MYTIIDTETTGLFDFGRPSDAEGQPRLASFAMLAADEDCRLICATHVLIRPDGWQMGAEAESINGLSQDLLEAHGVPVNEVVVRYAGEVMGGHIIVGHNVDFDVKIMRAELRRAGLNDLKGQTPTICTMRALTDVLQIPKGSGRGYKWPRLSEAVQSCLGRPPLGAHGALHDALDCLDLMRWLKDRALLPQPKGMLAA